MENREAPTRMTVRRDTHDGKASLRVLGPFDSISDHLLELAKEAVEEGHKELVLDLAGVTYMTSQGIACIIRMLKIVQSGAQALAIYKANPDMVDLIRLARIEKHIRFIE